MGQSRKHRSGHAAPTTATPSQGADTADRGNAFAQQILREGSGPSGSDPQGSFDAATSGSGGQVPYLSQMSAAFGTDFSSVSSHTGQGDALSGMGASAAAQGETVAFADSSPSKQTVAHELTHVVQSRQGGGGVQGDSGLSRPGSAAEREASAVASRVASGGSAGSIGEVAGGIHREEDGGGQTTGDGGSAAAGPDGGGDTPATAQRGADDFYTVRSGDTLRKIAKAQYTHESYWTTIRDENPEVVLDGGATFLVGDELWIERIETPDPVPSDRAIPNGGSATATWPRSVPTDNGMIKVWPAGYDPDFVPAAPDGVMHLTQEGYDAFSAAQGNLQQLQRGIAVTAITDLLSYEVILDWVITDSEATQAMQTLAALPFSQIQPTKNELGTKTWGRLIDNLPDDQKQTTEWYRIVLATGSQGDLTHPQLENVFDAAPDSDLVLLTKALGWRFELQVTGLQGAAWDAAGLRRAWGIMAQLPPGHISGNDEFDALMRNQSAAGSGYYSGGNNDRSVMGYGDDLEQRGSYGAIMTDNPNAGAETEDGGTEPDQIDVGLHTRVNLFNTVFRHEVGHAVDAKLGVSTGYATTATNAGKWADYGNSKTAFANAIIAGGNGMSGHGYPNEEAYEKALRKAINDSTDFNVALQALKDADEVADDVAAADGTTGGPVSAVFTKNRWHASASPWYNPGNQVELGGRRYHQAYDSWKYVSMLADTREKFGISGYQFRAPGEWFAEAYAAYYSDHDSATGNPVGTRLRTRDTATADYFDQHVDKGHSLPSETNQDDGS